MSPEYKHLSNWSIIACSKITVFNLTKSYSILFIINKLPIVFYFPDIPVVKLDLGKQMNASAIVESADVYFECTIRANPWVYKVTWRHNVSIILKQPVGKWTGIFLVTPCIRVEMYMYMEAFL